MPVDCQPGDTMGGGDVEKSFLWVANSDEGSVSKVDTQTMVELARYRTGPLGGGYAENPSRTAVSFDGKYVIVNGRQSGRSTVIAANLEDCVDKNGNGKIETSQNKADLLAWDADECKLWSIVHPIQPGNIGAGPRGVTWTPGTWDMDACAFKDPKVWVGFLPNQAGVANMVRLNGLTGAVEETVVVNNWVQGWTNYGPYGAALDKSKNVWFTGLRGELFRINTANNPATLDRWTPPAGTESYGMTVDPDGDPWMAGCSGPVTTYEPMLNKFTAVAGTNACYRGIAADHDGNVWVASNGTCGIAQIDHKTNTLIKFHNTNPCSTPVGVSVDLEGFVWLVDEQGWAWKIDPANPAGMKKVDITGDHYTYSDMTGGQLKSVILPQ
jgi:DNA-binding beta-propeller fold protein YncE